MMAKRPTGLRGIAYCHFASYYTGGERRRDWKRIIFFGVIPMVFGFFLSYKFGKPEKETLTMIIAVLSVLAAVLLGLLPLAHSIVGQANVDRKYSIGERPLASQELNRVQALQNLHAAISWAVILLVVALGCCAILAFLPDAKEGEELIVLTPHARLVLVLLYGIICSTALTFFDVAQGVFEGMESHSETIKTKIRNNIQKKANDEENVD
ncbi:MAG: hypothetical protein JEZ07_16205 [Phycisphaerae bacterium]|nr:hypothetical protein [Phycisphaerae bacterium]